MNNVDVIRWLSLPRSNLRWFRIEYEEKRRKVVKIETILGGILSILHGTIASSVEGVWRCLGIAPSSGMEAITPTDWSTERCQAKPLRSGSWLPALALAGNGSCSDRADPKKPSLLDVTVRPPAMINYRETMCSRVSVWNGFLSVFFVSDLSKFRSLWCIVFAIHSASRNRP